MQGKPIPLHGATFGDHRPAVNTAAVVTHAAAAGIAHVLHWILWSYDSAPTGGKLTVTINGAVVLEIDIAGVAGSPLFGFISFPAHADENGMGQGGIYGDVNQALVVTLAAAGAACKGKVAVKVT